MSATTTESGRSPLHFPGRRRRAGLVLAAALLAGCGGGISIGIGPDDDPPRVTLAVSHLQAAPGQLLTLLANASDDYGVCCVDFFQVLSPGGRLVYLDTVRRPPYQLTVQLPLDAQDPTQFLARAVDEGGQWAESTVLVRVLR